MKSFSITIVVLLFTYKGFCQSFDEKPFTFLEKQLLNNTKTTQIKNNIPSGYSLALEESDKIVLEKTINGKTYEIQYFFENGTLSGIMFTQHVDRIFKEFNELRELNYIQTNNMVFNGVETTLYSKESLQIGVILTSDENKRILTGSISKMKNNE